MVISKRIIAVIVVVSLVFVAAVVVNTLVALHADSNASGAIDSTRTTVQQLQQLQKQRRAQNFAHLAAITQTQTDAATAQCEQGNKHRNITNDDAKDTFDVDSLLVRAVSHPTAKQTKAQAALGRSIFKRLTKDITDLKRLPPINCTQAVEHPLSYVEPKAQPFTSP